MNPTIEQQAIFDYCATLAQSSPDLPNLFIEAGAGCGKTSTIVSAASYFADNPRSVSFLAFNKSIADELGPKLPDGIFASTFHSACLRALTKALPTKPKIDKFKTRVIMKNLIPEDDFSDYAQCVARVVSLAKNSGIISLVPNETKTFEALFDAHSIELDSRKTDLLQACKYAKEVIDRSYKSLEVIDFDDMLWLTFVRNCRMPQYTTLFTDESQDFNYVQLSLLGRMLPNYGRLIAVGDRYQAIYGFRGALTDSVDRMVSKFEMSKLPLSISFRCARSIIALAQDYNPAIVAREDAPDGHVRDLDQDWSIDSFRPGDAILCRTNAPIIRLAFQLLIARRQCYIEGREYGEQMIALVKKINPSRIEDLPKLLSIHKESQRPSLTLDDKIDAITALCDGCNNVGELITLIDTIFTRKPDSIVLSSVHKSKGLEFPRVWIYGFHSLMPHPRASETELQQELNLKYVAVTRAKTELMFIEPLISSEE